MIKDILLVVLPVTAALLSAYLTNRWNHNRWREQLDWQQRKDASERRERFYSQFMTTRLNALTHINAAMVACHFEVNHHANQKLQKLQIYEDKVARAVTGFEDTFHELSLWCSEDLTAKLREVQGAFRQMSLAIYFNLPQQEIPNVQLNSYPKEVRRFNWIGFNKSYDAAREALKQESGIGGLEEYVKDIQKYPSPLTKGRNDQL